VKREYGRHRSTRQVGGPIHDEVYRADYLTPMYFIQSSKGSTSPCKTPKYHAAHPATITTRTNVTHFMTIHRL